MRRSDIITIRWIFIMLILFLGSNISVFAKGSWTVSAIPAIGAEGANFYALHFVDDNEGWIVGSGGVMLHTRNGGRTFQKQYSRTDDLYGLYFYDNKIGWSVGSNGTILHTDDGGNNWRRQQSNTRVRLYSVHFVDANRGWIVGMNGTILATTDGGKIWEPRICPLSVHLKQVYFLNDQQGWIVGDRGAILRSIDGGKNWALQPSGVNKYLHGVYFVDSNTGWVVGDEGTIRHTNDGGNRWIRVESGTANWLHAVCFVGKMGWIVGDGGTILETTDGGQTFNRVSTLPGDVQSDILYDISYPGGITVWAISQPGQLFRYVDTDLIVREEEFAPKYLSEKITTIEKASLQVKSSPAGAKVFLNGEYFGVTPLSKADLVPGKYEVKVTKMTRGKRIKEIFLKPGDNATVSFGLSSRYWRPVVYPVSVGIVGVLLTVFIGTF